VGVSLAKGGQAINHAVAGVAALHNLKLDIR
jgi:hypothetical protein